MAGLRKQAKILTDKQVALALAAVATRRYPLRDGVIILLSVRAGLRAKEISNIRWSVVTDAEGAITDTIHLVNGVQGQARRPLNPYGQRPAVSPRRAPGVQTSRS